MIDVKKNCGCGQWQCKPQKPCACPPNPCEKPPKPPVKPPKPPFQTIRVWFKKVDAASGEGLPGANFALYDGRTLLGVATSNEEGLFNLQCQAPGSYILQELKSPDGYELTERSFSIRIDQFGRIFVNDKQGQLFLIPNSRRSGSFGVSKLDALSGAPLENAAFTLKNSSGQTVQTTTTDAFGHAVFSGLQVGSYTLIEQTPPRGYQPNNAQYAVEVQANGMVLINGTAGNRITIRNRPIRYSFAVQKLDAQSGSAIKGAEFVLLQGGSLIADARSGENGEVLFSNLTPGQYTLTELQAAEGYIRNDTEFTVLIREDGTVTIDGNPAQGFRIENSAFASFTVAKADQNSGEPLAGAVFELYFEDGRPAGTQPTNSEGLARFTALEPGIYSLVEITPPPGYLSNAAVYSIEVTQSGEVLIEGTRGTLLKVRNLPEQAQTTTVTGRVIFDDANNENGTRPGSVTIELYQNGEKIAELNHGSDEEAFSFTGLPPVDGSGNPYTYTVAQRPIDGYNTLVSGTTITNSLIVVSIEVTYFNDTGNVAIATQSIPALYGSTVTIEAPEFSGYTLAPGQVSKYTFTFITQDQQYTFHYVLS